MKNDSDDKKLPQTIAVKQNFEFPNNHYDWQVKFENDQLPDPVRQAGWHFILILMAQAERHAVTCVAHFEILLTNDNSFFMCECSKICFVSTKAAIDCDAFV